MTHDDLLLPLLPAPGARVLEIGCGPAGGLVPALLARGDCAVGVDPVAPEGPAYRRMPVEDVTDPGPLDAVVACVSLHHVTDLAVVLDRVARWLTPTGTLVVLEWAWERFDTRAAEWCFAALPPPASTPEAAAPHPHPAPTDHTHAPGQESGGGEGQGHGHGPGGGDGGEGGNWLWRHREGWRRSALDWDDYLRGWAEAEGVHRGSAILAALDTRFACDHLAAVPYFFTDLPGTSAADEQAAMDAGRLPASAFVYRGRPFDPTTPSPGRNP